MAMGRQQYRKYYVNGPIFQGPDDVIRQLCQWVRLHGAGTYSLPSRIFHNYWCGGITINPPDSVRRVLTRLIKGMISIKIPFPILYLLHRFVSGAVYQFASYHVRKDIIPVHRYRLSSPPNRPVERYTRRKRSIYIKQVISTYECLFPNACLLRSPYTQSDCESLGILCEFYETTESW